MLRRIAIVAGETSGDLLAARLILALKQYNPKMQFEGVAGPEMQAAGCHALFPMHKLSVMGLVEVLKHLPELLRLRHQLYQRWRDDPPDLFIGVDAPDFNLPLAKRLHGFNIPTVHYVSPSVWAWREKRVRKMQGTIDLMLTLFPFEVDFYQRHQIKAAFVGHPLADEITWNGDKQAAREALGLAANQPVLALLPGSRMGEIERLGADFLQAIAMWHKQYPTWQYVIPVVNAKAKSQLQTLQKQYANHLTLHFIEGQSRVAMQAADMILLASGTAVLEGMLSARPMVAAYRVNALTAWVLRRFNLLKVEYVTLPNNLAQECLVPELLQEQVTPKQLFTALQALHQESASQQQYRMQRFREIQQTLQQDASEQAAQAIIKAFDTPSRVAKDSK